MAQVTGKKVATTPMPAPSGASGAIIDSFNTQDDQTVNAPSIHIVKDALTTINDNLSKNTISDNTKVTLTYNTEYTTLSDGYFKIYAELGQNRTTGYVNNVSLISIVSSSTDYCMSSILVRKGSKIKFNGTSLTATTGIFYPLS